MSQRNSVSLHQNRERMKEKIQHITPDEQLSNDKEYQTLLDNISKAVELAHQKLAVAVNTILIDTNWEIGRYIVEFEQHGNARAKYGDNLINRLSKDLTLRLGKGYSKSNLLYIRKFYYTFAKDERLSHLFAQKGETPSHLLSWSHYFEILKLDDPLEISFYVQQCEHEHWSVSELKRQKKSLLFQRLALSKNKEGVLQLAREGQVITKPEDILHDPVVLEFAGIETKPLYKEGDLEEALYTHLEQFLLELGKGFTFIGRQQRLNIGGRYFYVDLVFYHRILKCFVLIDLKRGEIQHEDIGQMNLYLNYYAAEENTEGDNPPIGIILGSEKDRLLMEYALHGISNQLFVSRYQLYLPNREQLERELQQVLLDDNKEK